MVVRPKKCASVVTVENKSHIKKSDRIEIKLGCKNVT